MANPEKLFDRVVEVVADKMVDIVTERAGKVLSVISLLDIGACEEGVGLMDLLLDRGIEIPIEGVVDDVLSSVVVDTA